MKKHVFFIAFAFLTNIANAQWHQTSIDSGQVRCFTKSGNMLYAGTTSITGGIGYVYKSDNNGIDWTAMNTNQTFGGYGILSLTAKPDTIIVGTNGNKIYLYSDIYHNWLHSVTGLTNSTIMSLQINGNTLFAGTGNGVFTSSNNGLSWSVGTGLSYANFWSIAISGSNTFAGNDYGIYFSSNNGNDWNTVNNGLPINNHFYSLATKGDTILSGISYNGVYLSTDNGINWTSKSIGLPYGSNTTVYALAIQGNYIFAGTVFGVYYSTNNGNSWTSLNSGLPNGLSIFSLIINNDTIFAGTDGQGVWKMALSDLTVGIDAEIVDNYKIEVYPNPVSYNLTIKSHHFIEMEILNAQGLKVRNIRAQKGSTLVDISDFSNGLYFIKVKSDKGFKFIKFIKE